MPFGLPERQPDPAPIVEALADNNGDIQIVVSALTEAMGKELTTVEGLNKLVVDAAYKQLNKSSNLSNKQITESISQLSAQLQSLLITNQSELDATDAAITDAESVERPRVSVEGSIEPPSPTPPTNPDTGSLPGPSEPAEPWTVERETVGEGGADAERAEVITATLPGTGDRHPLRPFRSEEELFHDFAPGQLLGKEVGVLHSEFDPVWLSRMKRLRLWLRGVGKEVIDIHSQTGEYEANIAGKRTALLLLREVWLSDEAKQLVTVNMFGSIVATALQQAANQWMVQITTYFADAGPSAILIAAALRLLEAIDSFVQGSHREGSASEKHFAHLGVSGLGTGVGTEDERTRAYGAAARVELHTMLVPAIDAAKRCLAWELQLESYSLPEALELFNRNYISEEELADYARYNGRDAADVLRYAKATGEQLRPEQVLQLARRRGLDETVEDAELRNAGIVRQSDRDGLRELYDQLPGIADHLHWLQRNVFDEQYVADYQLMDGFEERFWSKFGPDLRAQGMKKETAAFHFAAHWIQPSPEQMKQFVYRNRLNRVPLEAVFTLDDFKRILAEQDYGVKAREWFAATAYQVPAISYIKEWFRQGIINEEELSQYHQDLGFDPKDSENFVAIDSLQKERMRRSSSHGWTTAAIAKAYSVGLMTPEEVLKEMLEMGYTVLESVRLQRRADSELKASIVTRARSRLLTSTVTSVKQALDVGIMTEQDASRALQAAGWPAKQADGIAAMESATGSVRQIKKAINHLRTSFLHGEIGAEFARRSLETLGVREGNITNYLTLWAVELTPGRKRRGANEIVSSLANGDVSQGDAYARLLNLGYTDADSRLYLADAARKLAGIASKQRAAFDKAGQARQKALDKLTRQSQQQSKKLLEALKKEAPVGKLERWLKLGIINEGTFVRRMRLYGYTDEWLDKRIKEVTAKAAKKGADGQVGPPGANGVAGGAAPITP